MNVLSGRCCGLCFSWLFLSLLMMLFLLPQSFSDRSAAVSDRQEVCFTEICFEEGPSTVRDWVVKMTAGNRRGPKNAAAEVGWAKINDGSSTTRVRSWGVPSNGGRAIEGRVILSCSC